MSQCPPAWFFGEIGSGVRSADDGFNCCAHKPFCSPLVRFRLLKKRSFTPRTCKPERNGPIGDSVGSNVLLATLASPLLHRFRSLSMVSLSRLPRHLALMWSWLHKRSDTPFASFFGVLSCLASLSYPPTSIYRSFRPHFSVLSPHANVVYLLIACLLSSHCVCRGHGHPRLLVPVTVW
jgi:hypothetical protein